MGERIVGSFNIEDDMFEDLRNCFNKMINKTLDNMRCKDCDAASLTIKIDILDGDLITAIKHKVTSSMQIKESDEGIMAGAYDLVWNGKEWTLCEDDNQIPLPEPEE